MSQVEIINRIKEYFPAKLVEITGGEPLMQKNIYPLLQELLKLDYKILLETNGSIDLREVPDRVIKIVDIKCPGSGHPESFLPENIKFINSEKDEIKFVLCSREDYSWAVNKITEYSLSGYNILFSSVFTALEPAQLAEWILKDKLDVKLQIQMHKYIWDPEKRGV